VLFPRYFSIYQLTSDKSREFRDNKMANGNDKIIREAVDRYGHLCPRQSPIPTIAFKLHLHERKLHRILEGEGDMLTHEFGQIMVFSSFPEGFDLLREFYFPHLKP